MDWRDLAARALNTGSNATLLGDLPLSALSGAGADLVGGAGAALALPSVLSGDRPASDLSDIMDSARGALTYAPRTDRGKEAASAMQSAIDPVSKWYGGVKDKVADHSALAGALMATAPTAAGFLIPGAKGARALESTLPSGLSKEAGVMIPADFLFGEQSIKDKPNLAATRSALEDDWNAGPQYQRTLNGKPYHEVFDDYMTAMHMKDQGSPARAIKSVTGFETNPHTGRMEYELSDARAKVMGSTDPSGKFSVPEGQDLSSVLLHPELHDAVSSVSKIKTAPPPTGEGEHGWYDSPAQQISVAPGTPDSVRSTMLHETAHAIQDATGAPSFGSSPYAHGWSSDLDNKLQRSNEVLKGIHSDPETRNRVVDLLMNPSPLRSLFNPAGRILRGMSPEERSGLVAELYKQRELRNTWDSAYENYRNDSGEQAARRTEARSDLLPDELRDSLFYDKTMQP